MVEYMRSTVVFAVIVCNFILASLNIFFSIMAMDENPHYYYRLLSSNEILSDKNQNYYIKDILDKEIESPKELRNLDYNSLRLGLLITDSISFLFIIVLIMSFWMTPNECCKNNEDFIVAFPIGSCNGKCLCCDEGRYFGPWCPNCPACNILSYILRGIFLVPFFVFAITYLIFKACGKHAARMVAVIALMILDVILFIMSLVEGLDTYCILVAVCAFISLVGNLLAIILPNCKDCECFSYYVIEQPIIDEQYDRIENSEENAFPNKEEVVQDPIIQSGDPDTDNKEQNQGNDVDDRNSINPFDAPTPLSVKDNNDENNIETISYPKPE